MGQEKTFRSLIDSQKNHSNCMTFRMPLIEIYGRKRVLIENHLGIFGYDVNVIIVNAHLGYIYVQGRELKITKICKEKILITGVIDEICFRGRE